MKRALAAAGLVVALLLAPGAAAHKPSDSYLSLDVAAAMITGRWDIALRDLDVVLDLDRDRDDAISWGEVRARQADIAAYALSRLTLRAGAADCAPVAGALLVDRHSDGAYAVLRFTVACTHADALAVDYRLLFDVDPQHRGLLQLTAGGRTQSAIFANEAPARRFALAGGTGLGAFVDYLREGVAHIATGFDHVLFLLSLLVPAVLVRTRAAGGDRWQGAPCLRSAFVDVVRVVTAFTLAHSITLSLAAVGAIALPTRLVESAIALSVVLAALNNLWPVMTRRRWIAAFGFGLIHGFGFASLLTDLGLPPQARLTALVAFNLGVELGQLAIVAVFLPLAFALRETWFYQRTLRVGASAGVAAVGALWLAERALGLALLPALLAGS